MACLKPCTTDFLWKAFAKAKLYEIRQALDAIEAQSEEFRLLQRRYFLTTEKYLDAGSGFAPFKEARCCELCLKALNQMEDEGWSGGEATIMPDHLHLLIIRQNEDFSFKQVLNRFKGRFSRWINQELERSGRFWQEDWFDRWMRHEGERDKCIDYIRNNRVKAKIVSNWVDHPWRLSTDWESSRAALANVRWSSAVRLLKLHATAREKT